MIDQVVSESPITLDQLRLVRVIAFGAGLALFGAAARAAMEGSRRWPAFPRGALSWALVSTSLLVVASVAAERVWFGIQPPILYFLCLPLFWLGAAALLFAGGCGSAERREEPEAPPVLGDGYRYDHFTIDGAVSRQWINSDDLPKNRDLLWNTATAVLRNVMKRLRDRSVLQAIEDQLAADARKSGKKLPLRVHIEIQEDNYWKKLGLAAITMGGTPATIFINLDTLTNLTPDQAAAAIIHELLHAKSSAYIEAGLPSPYPAGHNDPAFKAREEELKKKLA